MQRQRGATKKQIGCRLRRRKDSKEGLGAEVRHTLCGERERRETICERQDRKKETVTQKREWGYDG